MKKGLLIWWSNNSRAESVLAKVASDSGIPLGIVISESQYPPSQEVLNISYIYRRVFSEATFVEIEKIANNFAFDSGCEVVVLAPTSEYVMDLVSEKTTDSFTTPFRSRLRYKDISSKLFMANFFELEGTLQIPQHGDLIKIESKFIAKPKFNVADGTILKPFMVDDESSRHKFIQLEHLYFPQEYISPPSFYWCAYKPQNGEICSYFQRNILQDKNGGSIICAELSDPPNSELLNQSLQKLLRELEFFGPIMIEFRGDGLKFIEINPRFWGPLIISLQMQNNPIKAFFQDMFDINPNISSFEALSRIYVVPSLLNNKNRLVNVSGFEDDKLLDLDNYKDASNFNFSQLGGRW